MRLRRAQSSRSSTPARRVDEHDSHGQTVLRDAASLSGYSAQREALSPTQTVQMEVTGAAAQPQKPKKKVSGKAMGRLGKCRDAIKHTKAVMAFGAGNQLAALKASNWNSYFRLRIMRDPRCWEISPSVKAISSQFPNALTAAKADLAHGGNCGEHAAVAYDYLRSTAGGENIAFSQADGLDHAFVLMGDLKNDSDQDICVSDPWPSAATATVWEDHFAHTADRADIIQHYSMKADGKNHKSVIAAGLKLSAKGLRMVNKHLSTKETSDKIAAGEKDGWIWEHDNAASGGRDYDYSER